LENKGLQNKQVKASAGNTKTDFCSCPIACC